MAKLPSDISSTSKNHVQQDSVTETGADGLSSPEKATINDLLKTEVSCVLVKTSVSDNHNVRGSENMAELPSDTDVMSKILVQQDSVTETGVGALSSPEKANYGTSSFNVQHRQTAECPTEVSVLVVDAQSSPIQFQSTRSIGCTPVIPSPTAAETLHGDVRLTETVECFVQTSPCMVDGSCSPLHQVVTCSTGCSPTAIETRSAGTSPISFPPTVGCSVQTERWTIMVDAQYSPVVLPHCEDSQMADAETSPSQGSTEHDAASFSPCRPRSRETAESTSPNLPKNNPPSASDEVFSRKLSSVVSQSSYETPPVVAYSSEDPQRPAAADSQQSCEDSTQPCSCEELFVSPLSFRSPSSVAHQPRSTCPSQCSYLEASPWET